MKQGAKQMKQEFKHINIDEIEDMQDEMSDLLEQSNDIQEVLGRAYGVPDDVDEADLEAELEGLQADLAEEALGDEVPSYLSAPSVPSTAPSLPAGQSASKLPELTALEEK